MWTEDGVGARILLRVHVHILYFYRIFQPGLHYVLPLGAGLGHGHQFRPVDRILRGSFRLCISAGPIHVDSLSREISSGGGLNFSPEKFFIDEGANFRLDSVLVDPGVHRHRGHHDEYPHQREGRDRSADYFRGSRSSRPRQTADQRNQGQGGSYAQDSPYSPNI